MESQDKNEFSYTYSASEQEELKLIRRKYLSPEEDKLTRHRRLDAGVTRKGSVIALIIGIFGRVASGHWDELCSCLDGEVVCSRYLHWACWHCICRSSVPGVSLHYPA